MANRKGIGKKKRFEIFKRDSFTCQYCGEKAPDVILELDHINPVSKGGDDSILNLITSCKGCNSGKSDRRLSDETVVSKKQAQLADLQERKRQMEMMFEWQKGLLNIDDQLVEKLSEYWNYLIPTQHLTESGKNGIKKLLRKFKMEELMQAMNISVSHYLEFQDSKPTSESVEWAFKKLGGICHMKRLDETDPDLSKLYYIRSIMNKKFDYFDYRYMTSLLKQAKSLGVCMENLEESAKAWRNWNQAVIALQDFIRSKKSGGS